MECALRSLLLSVALAGAAGAADDVWYETEPRNTGPGLRKGLSLVTWEHQNDIGQYGAVTFGGSSAAGGKMYSDLSVLDEESMAWVQPILISGSPPAPRADHAAVPWINFVNGRDGAAAHGAMVMFGGRGYGGGFLSDVHWFDLATNSWFTPAVTGDAVPSARASTAADLTGASSNTLIMFGGQSAVGCENDVWRLQLAPTWRWDAVDTQGTAPSARMEHSALSWSNAALSMLSLVVYGGTATDGALSGPCFDDVFVLDLHLGANVWTAVTPRGGVPPARRAHAAAVRGAPGAQEMVVFGGVDSDGAALGDAWVLTLAGAQSAGYDFAWAPLKAAGGAAPTARAGVRATSWGADRIVFVGGYTIAGSAETVVDDVFVLGPATPNPTPFPTMSPTTKIPTTAPTSGPHAPTLPPASSTSAAKGVAVALGVVGALVRAASRSLPCESLPSRAVMLTHPCAPTLSLLFLLANQCLLAIAITAICVLGNIFVVPPIARRIRRAQSRPERQGVNSKLDRSASSETTAMYEQLDDGTSAGDILRSLQQQRMSDASAATVGIRSPLDGSRSSRALSGTQELELPGASASDAGQSGEAGRDASGGGGGDGHHRRASSEAAILEFQRSWDDPDSRPASAARDSIAPAGARGDRGGEGPSRGSARSASPAAERHERSTSDMLRSMTTQLTEEVERSSPKSSPKPKRGT
jgi:hypothetical protein